MKSVLDFQRKKQSLEKITMITCYDYTSAKIIANTNVDCVLVGDSGGMVQCGYENTTHTKISDMEFMTKAVANGLNNKFIIADLPFMSYRVSLAETMHAVTSLIQAGAHAVKLEGVAGNLDMISHIVESGVPVMGHIGLTPQMLHSLGGFKVQARNKHAAQMLIDDAKKLAASGCFALVIECVPSEVATIITNEIGIPTIGIGAGSNTDGQVLVLHDLLGLNNDFKPKFVKKYLQGADLIINAVDQYVAEVAAGVFPDVAHSYAEAVI